MSQRQAACRVFWIGAVSLILFGHQLLALPPELRREVGSRSQLAHHENAVACDVKMTETREEPRGPFWVLYNYVTAARRFHCWESITITTHADYTFLDNLQPMLERWQGPVSLTLHAPGEDLKPTLKSISWARNCVPLVANLVTFHIVYDQLHIPQEVPRAESVIVGPGSNCSAPAPWTNVSVAQLYRKRRHLVYPINVARNVARESATTHFVLPLDIELYPSPGIISAFLKMVHDHPSLQRPAPKVFVLPIFELKEDSPLPRSKAQIIRMMKIGTAIPFHKQLCGDCHKIPQGEKWKSANLKKGIHVFHVAKRQGRGLWEPIYIGTNKEPLYEERLPWEGKFDKLLQAYIMCVLDYEFHILDNAFLVHKPGIKAPRRDPEREMYMKKTTDLLRNIIRPQLDVVYGRRQGCTFI